MKALAKNLSSFKIDNLVLQSNLSVEQTINDTPRKVLQYHFCRSVPKPRNLPHLSGLSRQALKLLDLDYESVLADPNSQDYLSGTKLLPNSKPVCSNYCGYQFGNWAGQLGDGRAHILGSYLNQSKERWELQLKGSGKSPFSRFADGNSVVSSALREFLCSQLLEGLGVPTTRAASLVIADEPVKRDPFYNGNIKIENAAVVLRLSPSFIRFGSFELCNEGGPCRKQDSMANRQFLKVLADYLIKNYYPHLEDEQLGDPYEGLFNEILEKSARLVAKWQSVGFVHGVMNTDNMSMHGITIDFGPFGFVDYFSKDFVSNATDTHERYSYRQQPAIIKWNLIRLAEALDPLVPASILKKAVNQKYDGIFKKEYYKLMRQKLGISEGENAESLVDQLIDVLHEFGCNFTNVFRILSENIENKESIIGKLVEQSCPIKTHYANMRVFPQLLGVTPQILKKIDEEESGFNKYLIIEQPLRIAKQKQLSTISKEQYQSIQKLAWSNWLDKYSAFKKDSSLQDKTNPRYVLRNDVANKILAHLNSLPNPQQPEFLNRVLSVFTQPTAPSPWFQELFWSSRCDPIKLTCSS